MPTAVTPTVPPYFFCTWGYVLRIQQKTHQMILISNIGRNCSQSMAERPSQAFSTFSTGRP